MGPDREDLVVRPDESAKRFRSFDYVVINVMDQRGANFLDSSCFASFTAPSSSLRDPTSTDSPCSCFLNTRYNGTGTSLLLHLRLLAVYSTVMEITNMGRGTRPEYRDRGPCLDHQGACTDYCIVDSARAILPERKQVVSN